MAAANYQASKARIQFIEMKRKQEEWEIDNLPDQEKNEIREIYKKKGFKGELLEVVQIITSRRKIWVDTMMKEELGLIEDEKTSLNSSVSTFIGFNLIGLIPLIPFIIFIFIGISANSDAFIFATISVMLSFFLVGMIKGKFVKKPKIKSGIFTLIIGGIAAVVAYFVGYGLNFLIN